MEKESKLNNIHNYNENDDKNKEKIEQNEQCIDDANDIINIIFILENYWKIGIQADKNEKLMDAIEKLGEKEEEYNDFAKMLLFDGDKEITDQVKDGEIISSFGFENFHTIQVK